MDDTFKNENALVWDDRKIVRLEVAKGSPQHAYFGRYGSFDHAFPPKGATIHGVHYIFCMSGRTITNPVTLEERRVWPFWSPNGDLIFFDSHGQPYELPVSDDDMKWYMGFNPALPIPYSGIVKINPPDKHGQPSVSGIPPDASPST